MIESAEAPSVWVIVVSYEGAEWIGDCLQSVMDSTYPTGVIVVDNGSTDGTVKIVNEFPEVRCISLDRNVGFGPANNIGIREALDRGTDYVFLLNQDAFLPPQTVEVLVNEAEKNPDFGVLSPLHLNGDGTRIDTRFTRYVAHGAPGYFSDLRLAEPKAVYPLRFVNAAAWLVSRECLEQVGGFDPLFFLYEEDLDFCVRVRHQGLKVGIVPAGEILHARDKAEADFKDAWERRWTNLETVSRRVKSRHMTKLKDPSQSFSFAVVSMCIDFFADIVRAACQWKLHWTLVNVIGFWRLIVTLPRIWRHRKLSARAGAHWL